MSSVLVCVSESHGNTRKVAEAMAEVLGSRVAEPDQVEAAELVGQDLVGFGSGIFNTSFHPRLRRFVQELPAGQSGRAFVYATSGFPPRTRPLVRLLESKGYEVVGTFSVRGWDTWWPFKPFGGTRQGRPDSNDLDEAREFARGLLTTSG